MNPIRLSSQSALKHCQHRGSAGRRCRMPVSDPASGFCFHHAAQQKKYDDAADLSAALTGNSEEFRTVEGINQSLGELYKLLAQDRISPRRAAASPISAISFCVPSPQWRICRRKSRCGSILME